MSIQEIAKIAGVSKSTVSRVINDDENVSDVTRERVKKVINQYGYQPNRAARALVNRRTQAIGVVISNNIGTFFDTSQYFPTLLRGISDTLTQHDYAILLMLGKDNEDDLRFARRIVRGQMFDGIILVSPAIGHPLIDELLSTNTTFVSADRIQHPSANISYISVENVESSRRAVQHLISLGRRRIAMIAGNAEIIDTHDRITGYRKALADAGIAFDPDLLVLGSYTNSTGYNAIGQLLDNNIPFDGVYASQASMALGAVNALFDRGIQIPQEVSLIAFDDLAENKEPRIGISTMHHPVLEKGQLLGQTLIDLIEDKVAPPIQRFLPAELVIRATCGG